MADVKLCDGYCVDCLYCGFAGGELCCHYIFVENKRRPCPAGGGCTVKKRGAKPYNRKANYVERREIAERKEKERAEKRRFARLCTMICRNCGKRFETTDTRRRHCSVACSEEYREAWCRERERARYEKRKQKRR